MASVRFGAPSSWLPSPASPWQAAQLSAKSCARRRGRAAARRRDRTSEQHVVRRRRRSPARLSMPSRPKAGIWLTRVSVMAGADADADGLRGSRRACRPRASRRRAGWDSPCAPARAGAVAGRAVVAERGLALRAARSCSSSGRPAISLERGRGERSPPCSPRAFCRPASSLSTCAARASSRAGRSCSRVTSGQAG